MTDRADYTEVFADEQQLSEKDKELLSLIYQRVHDWGDALQPYYERVKCARKVFLLDDPEQDSPDENGGKKPRNKTIQLQTLRSTINNCVADQMDNMPEALLAPERPGLEGVATDLTDVVHYIMGRNHYEDIHRLRAEDFFVAGTAVTQVTWDETMDYGHGDVAVIRWPVEAMIWDPYVNDIQEGRAVMKCSWHPHSWFEEHYPDKARFVGSDEAQHRNIGKPDAQEELSSYENDQAMLIEYWWRTFDAKSRRYKINVAYVAGYCLLDKVENVYKHGRYPFRFDAYSSVEGSPAGVGLVEELTPMMRYVNRYARYIDENLRMSAKTRMLIRKDSGVDVEALANWDSNIITGDNIDPNYIQWLQSKPLNGVVVQQMLQYQTDIKQDSGQNQFMRGETAGGITAASAISALQEAGGKLTRSHTNILNQGFREIVEQMIWLVAQFYDEDKERMITGADGKSHQVLLNGEHLMGLDQMNLPSEDELMGMIPPGFDGDPQELMTKLRRTAQRKLAKRKREFFAPPYTVDVQVQRRNPLRVQAQNDLFIQAYTMAAQAGQQFPLSLLFDLLVVDGKERILPVLQQVDQQSAMMQQLAAENEQLKAQNEQLSGTVQQQGAALRDMGQSGPAPVEAPEGEALQALTGTPDEKPF